MTQTITQAMILAAGKGTRLRPLTLHTPKPLVPVANKPMIVWHLEALKQAGICDIAINTSWLSDKLIASLGDGSEYGVNIHWSVEDGEPLETAGGIATALHHGHLRPEPFVLINGDICTDYPFHLLASHRLAESKALAHLILVDNPSHHPEGDFYYHQGYAYSDNPSLEDKIEKYTFSGMSIISPQLLTGVQPHHIQPLAPLLRDFANQQKITASVFTGTWINADTSERLERANQWRLQSEYRF